MAIYCLYSGITKEIKGKLGYQQNSIKNYSLRKGYLNHVIFEI